MIPQECILFWLKKMANLVGTLYKQRNIYCGTWFKVIVGKEIQAFQ